MRALHFAYNLSAFCLSLGGLPLAWCYAASSRRRRAVLAQRLGYAPAAAPDALRQRPRVWMHAVSVGEVKAAQAIVRALDADTSTTLSILLTTTTATGQRYAHHILGQRAVVRYAPLDLWSATGRFLSAYQPDLLACLETEIWPNWIFRAHGGGIKTVFLNGRLSERSIRSYRRLRPFLGPLLGKVDAFSMISTTDARRMIDLGAPRERVEVSGNAKMDLVDEALDDGMVDAYRSIFGVDAGTPVWVAGSIRGDEATILMDVYARLKEKFPELVFIVAPRHIENASRIADAARDRRLAWQRRSGLGPPGHVRRAPVVILDTIGELRHVYGIASIVYCGGSLVPLGGQNVLEPAAWAKPILYGPFMADFEAAATLLERAGGGMRVADGAALTATITRLLTHPEDARRMGHRARQSLLANQGAARRHARVICRELALPVAGRGAD